MANFLMFLVRFSEANLAHDGRTVYKLKDLDSGVPKNVSSGKQYDSVREKISRGWTNKDLMKNGNAPIGSGGRYVNLHHVFGTEPGPIIEMEASAHTAGFREFHKLIKESFRRDSRLERAYEDFRELHWITRGNNIR